MKIFCTVFLGVIGLGCVRFFSHEIPVITQDHTYDYTMELTYADGSKMIVTDYADRFERNNEQPQIKSGILHHGYYVEINNQDYYGVVSLKCINKTKSRYTQPRATQTTTGMTPYDYYKQGCPLLDCLFREDEYLYNKRWLTILK